MTLRFDLLAPLALLASCTATPAHLNDANLNSWLAQLAPSASELAWQSLPWLPTYAAGIDTAQSQRRPLLLWVMNGHPLGCT